MKNDVIKFLLGEGPLDGVWFSDKHPTERGAFWWRKHLRQFITQNQPNSGNTVLAVSGKDFLELIFAVGYTLDAIDVRATEPRRYESKEKAAKILEKLSSACASGAVDTDAKLPVSGSAFSIHDLKCGNILNYDTAEGEILPTVIDWQDLKWLTEDPKGFNLVHSPIPLTEEWLLKFGFSDKDYKKGYIGKDFKSGGMILDFVLSKPFSKGEWNNTYTFDFEGHRFSKMEFVHELQNFYYCLTGVMLSLS